MKNARWNDQNIAAINYDVRIHGENIFCCCGAKVICVTPNNDGREPFFKTTGREDSRHRSGCGEVRHLYINYIEKATKYIDTVGAVSDKELIAIPFNLGHEKRLAKGNVGAADEFGLRTMPNYINKPNRIESKLHHSIRTLKKIVSLIKKNEAEELSKLAFKINGQIIRFFELVINQNTAYEKARLNEGNNQEYIVYGKIQSIKKTDKVMFINLDEQDGAKPFAIVIFANKFGQFAFVDQGLERKCLLTFGNVTLKKNGYDGAQMILNDKNYLELLPD